MKKVTNDAPLVSVIVPTFNRRQWLVSYSLPSLLNQSFENFEIILVNDAGESVSDIANMDGRIRYFENKENKGLGATRNVGLSHARGKYVCFLDDDDSFWDHHIEVLYNHITKYNYDIVYSNAIMMLFEKAENQAASYNLISRQMVYDVDFMPDILLCNNISPVNTFMLKKSMIDKFCPNNTLFPEDVKVYEDWLAWLKLMKNGVKFNHLRLCTCDYTFRQDGSTMSSSRDFSTPLVEIFKINYPFAQNKTFVASNMRNFLKARNLPDIDFEKFDRESCY